MKKFSLPEVSMEAISYQGRSMLLFDLISAIETFRVSTSNPEHHEATELQVVREQGHLDRLNLSGIVEKRTGLKTLFLLREGYDCNAEPPLLDASNPFYHHVKPVSEREEIAARFQRALRLATEVQAWVDLPAGRVHGVFANLTNRVYIGYSILMDLTFTSEEVAAIIVHELGHLFSFYETMGYTTASNMVVTTATDALSGVQEHSQRLRIISQATSAYKAKPPQEITEETSTEVVKALLMQTLEQAEQDRARMFAADKSNRYNTRSIEFMADQFAVRMGCAVPLASAQHRLAQRASLTYTLRSQYRTTYYAMQACRMAMFALLLTPVMVPTVIGAPVAIAVSLLYANDAANSDDRADPGERIGQMAHDLVQLLKDNKLSKQSRKQILDDLETINALRDVIKKQSGIFRFLHRNILPYGRRQAKIRDFQKGLEDLINNPLFVHANRLRTA